MAFCVLKVHMICEHMKENINQSVYVKRQGQIIQSSNNVDFLPTNAPPPRGVQERLRGILFFLCPPFTTLCPPVHPPNPFMLCTNQFSYSIFQLRSILGVYNFRKGNTFFRGTLPPTQPKESRNIFGFFTYRYIHQYCYN